jgi:hypothetical protein
MRSPRFRRVPFIRNGVSDHGRVVAPRMTVRNMLPAAFVTVSASAGLSLSRLNIPLHMIAVYASWSSSPAPTQHSRQGGSLLPYPGRTFTGWTAPASPGALQTASEYRTRRDLDSVGSGGRTGRHAGATIALAFGHISSLRWLTAPWADRMAVCSGQTAVLTNETVALVTPPSVVHVGRINRRQNLQCGSSHPTGSAGRQRSRPPRRLSDQGCPFACG